MRVPDDVLKCVGFIGEMQHQDSSGVSGELRATGFFVAIPCESPELKDMRTCYFVTAKDVEAEIVGRETYLGFADVILVEARSIGGLSGSRVFVRHTLGVKVQREGDGGDDLLFANGPGITLLGLMHGHWDIRESEMNKASIIQDRQHGVN